MSQPVGEFQDVWKQYRRYQYIPGGVKALVLGLVRVGRKQLDVDDRHEVLRGITFALRAGRRLGVIGRNGVGKSTLLGLTAGVLKPTTGRVIVRRRPLAILELGAGFEPEFTGAENVLLYGMLLGRSRSYMVAKRREILEFAELREAAHEPIRTYSSGMLARLGFSILVHLEPELLLVDEVLGVGDLSFREKCRKRMLELQTKGVTMILVSHNMDDVRETCDCAMWIEGGTVRMLGDPESVTRAYELEVESGA